MSLIMFYHRLFPIKKVTYALSFCTFLVLGWWIAIYVVAIVQCTPYSHFWEQYLNPEAKGKCINVYAFFMANAALSVMTDFIILLIPIPLVMNLQMPLSQRIFVCSIFLLGGLYVPSVFFFFLARLFSY
jgi:hypothetical protein